MWAKMGRMIRQSEMSYKPNLKAIWVYVLWYQQCWAYWCVLVSLTSKRSSSAVISFIFLFIILRKSIWRFWYSKASYCCSFFFHIHRCSNSLKMLLSLSVVAVLFCATIIFTRIDTDSCMWNYFTKFSINWIFVLFFLIWPQRKKQDLSFKYLRLIGQLTFFCITLTSVIVMNGNPIFLFIEVHVQKYVKNFKYKLILGVIAFFQANAFGIAGIMGPRFVAAVMNGQVNNVFCYHACTSYVLSIKLIMTLRFNILIIYNQTA